MYMVFDVESLGLYGAGFAWGYVVVDRDSKPLGQGYGVCIEGYDWQHAVTNADPEDAKWVIENVLPAIREVADGDNMLTPSNCESFAHLREMFWESWFFWKERGVMLVADCAYPVETNFLSAVVRDRPVPRKWQAPYPLLDVAPTLLAAGMDPIGNYDRLPDELPKHHPLCDARQSARLFLDAMGKVGAV